MFFTQIEKAPVSFPKNKVTYDATSGVMNINVTTKFTQNLTGDYKVVIAIVEDSVKGTTTAYNQSNAYAGGTNGVMGGYEKLTNPVPAKMAIYMHVARALIGTYAGDGNALPDNLVANTDYPFDATYTIPTTWKAKNLKVVGMVVLAKQEKLIMQLNWILLISQVVLLLFQSILLLVEFIQIQVMICQMLN